MRLLLCLALLALLAPACVRVSSNKDGSKVEVSVPGVSISVTEDGDGSQVKVSAPGATVEVGTDHQLGADELGVPLYPGATHAGTATARSRSEVEFEAAYETADSVIEVERYYDQELPAEDGWRHRKQLTPVKREAEYRRPEGSRLRQVIVSDESGATIIRIRFGPER